MTQPAFNWRPGRSQIIWLVLLMVAIYAVLPQFGDFHGSLQLIRRAQVGWLGLALLSIFGSYGLAAGTYCLLAFRRLRYLVTALVQLSGAFADRLLPAGIGGIGVNYVYLRHARHTPAQSAGVVTVNNLLGLTGHLLVTAVVLALFSDRLATVNWSWRLPAARWQYGLLTLVAAILLLVAVRYRRRVSRALSGVLQEIARYRQRLPRLGAAQLVSIGMTLANVICLYCCSNALRLDISFVLILLIFSIGIILGTLTPTPGGIGGIEAGLVAGFVAVGVAPPAALAVVLLYRVISYWLAMLAGAPAFVLAWRLGYFDFKRTSSKY